MVHSLDFTRIPGLAVLATVTAVVLGYVPLTGLDHLHLHVDHEEAYAHDHLNIGHHEHGHHHHQEPGGEQPGDRNGEPNHNDSTVVTSAQGAQISPSSVAVQTGVERVDELPWIDNEFVHRIADSHPSWSSRAPPT